MLVIRILLPAILAAHFFMVSPLSAQSGRTAGKDTRPVQSSGKATPAPKSDETIRQEIEKRFARSKIGQNGFTVTVSRGIATIDGATEVPQHKGVATRLARSSGAREVVNRIRISASGRERLRKSLETKNPRQASASPDADQKKIALDPGATTGENRAVGTAEKSGTEERIPASNRQNAKIKQFRVLGPEPRGDARSERRRRY